MTPHARTPAASDAAVSDAAASDAVSPALLLIDGSSYLYRAFHAMPDLRADPADVQSQPTGAIRGMVNMLNSLRKDWPQATYAACVFDAPGPTFRDALFANYKANHSSLNMCLWISIRTSLD